MQDNAYLEPSGSKVPMNRAVLVSDMSLTSRRVGALAQ